MKSSTTPILLLLSTCLLGTVTSFAPTTTNTAVVRTTKNNNDAASPSALFMAGFGGGGATKGKKGNNKDGGAKLPKLKAKAQWDRYLDLKTSQRFTVGIRMTGGDDNNDWMEVGRVRSDNDELTEVAIARQRALIAEHAKRLYPVQIPTNAIVEWGYLPSPESSEWTIVDKSKGDDAPSGCEKTFGFEGNSDKATGFYCFYHEGRIVEVEGGGKPKTTVADGSGGRM